MLLKQDYTEGNIVSFKLVNGDEILARVLNSNSDSWTITKPLTVVPSEKGLGLVQSMLTMSLDDSVELQRSSVAMHTLTVAELGDHYILTTTGIQPVTRGSIITGA
jgi:hypothetical protein